MKYRLRVDKMGRITIPKAVRKRLGIKEGETIVELEVRELSEELCEGVTLEHEVIIIRVLVR